MPKSPTTKENLMASKPYVDGVKIVIQTDVGEAKQAAAQAVTDSQQALQDAKDALTVANGKASPQYVSNAVSAHDTATDAHQDIRAGLKALVPYQGAGKSLDMGENEVTAKAFNAVTDTEKVYTAANMFAPGDPFTRLIFNVNGTTLVFGFMNAGGNWIKDPYSILPPGYTVEVAPGGSIVFTTPSGKIILNQSLISTNDGMTYRLNVSSPPGHTVTFTDDGVGVTGGKAAARYLPVGIEAEGGKLAFPEIGGVIATEDYARGEANRVEEGLQDELYLTNKKLGGKLDKVTTVATLERAYTVDPTGTVQSVALISPSPTPNSIAKRDNGGRLSVNEPLSDSHTATKLYVENAIARVPNVFVPVFSLLGRSTDLTSEAAPDYTTLASNIDSIRLAVLTALNDVAGIWLANCSPGVKRVRFVRAIQHSNQPTASALTSALQTGKLFWLTYTQFCVLCMEGGNRNYVPWNEMEERADALLQSSPVGEVTVTGQTNVIPFVLSFPAPSQVTDIPSDESVTLFIKFSTPISVTGASLLVGVV